MEWIRGPTIGRGATATVSLATAISSGEILAVKSSEMARSMFLQREQCFLSKLSSPYLVKYMGCGVSNENDQSFYNLYMEYVPGGTLSDEIFRQGGKLGEKAIKLYTKQILQGLEYLHMNGLVHCDVKSQNVLLGAAGAKIADLGCAKLVGEGEIAASGFSGTPMFMAPEVARGEDQGFAADIWAVGCTIIEMGTGKLPWPELNDPVSALYKIGFSGDLPAIPSWFSEKGKEFLGNCLKLDAKDRWTAEELLKHPFLEETESNSEEERYFKTISPKSVLDQGFWDPIEVSESPRNPISENSYLNSPAGRIKSLIGSSSPADWTSEDWIPVRNKEVEENMEFADMDEENVIVEEEDELSIETPIFLDSTHEDDDESSSFAEDQSEEYSVETICFGCVIVDEFVLNNPSFGSNNEHSYFIQNLSFLFHNIISCSIFKFESRLVEWRN